MSRVTSLRDTTCYKVATLYKMAKTESVNPPDNIQKVEIFVIQKPFFF